MEIGATGRRRKKSKKEEKQEDPKDLGPDVVLTSTGRISYRTAA
jgi:hypothetical protein